MKFRKKPVVIDAVKWNGTPGSHVAVMQMATDPASIEMSADRQLLRIATLEGLMIASFGDWIIKGVKGELYPCKPDIFEATYEPVQEVN